MTGFHMKCNTGLKCVNFKLENESALTAGQFSFHIFFIFSQFGVSLSISVTLFSTHFVALYTFLQG